MLLQPQIHLRSAVLRLQKYFRGYRVRVIHARATLLRIVNRQHQVLVAYSKNVFQMLDLKRATLRIVRWLSNIPTFSRAKFWRSVQFYLSRVRSNELFIQKEAYFQLNYISDQNEKLRKILEQRHRIVYDHLQKKVRLEWDGSQKDLLLLVL